MTHNDRLLRYALRGNSLFSLGSALTLFVFNDELQGLMGFEVNWLLPTVGIGLMLFAFDLYQSAARTVIDQKRAKAFVAMDLAWVAASIFLVAIGLLTSSGHWIVVGVAGVVADFAFLQFVGLRRITRGTEALKS